MPIYEYKCQSCDAELEVFVRSKTEPDSCPECDGQLSRKISRAGVIFKGSGFYVNDSRGSGGDKKSSSSTASKSSDSGASESKSETKASGGDTSSVSKTESSAKPG